MKSVGKQLQEAREARNWTPELAARETKIKVDRLRDLEADDYTHFSSPTYARGFVRTYARAMGLDEYKILRQLDHKLPEDETPSFASDSGIPYAPEPAKHSHASTGSNAGLYVVLSLGFGVVLIIAFVFFEAYRAGVLPSYFAENSSPEVATTNTPPSETPARAMPVDPNAVPPPAITEAADTNSNPKALPVDPSAPIPPTATTAPSTDTPVKSVRALPVDPSELTNAPSTQVASATLPAAAPAPTTDAATNTTSAPRALPVDPSELTGESPAATAGATNTAPTATPGITNTALPATPPPAPPPVVASVSARQSNSGPVHLPPTDSTPTPPTNAAPVPTTTSAAPPVASQTASPASTAPSPDKHLVLTASRDSFVRVTSEDASSGEKVLYASMLHTGQSVGFDGRKFSINVGIPAAVDVTLDGVNYGPHSDQEAPETFSVTSHQP